MFLMNLGRIPREVSSSANAIALLTNYSGDLVDPPSDKVQL
jgi:hypothetical protein